MIRLGGPVLDTYHEPHEWIRALQRLNYSAAYCPDMASEDAILDFANAAQEADILIAEVGVWNNPLDSDPEARRRAIRQCQERLDLAERIGAACCVNIAGSRGALWDGPHPDNLSEETFEMIVETTRAIIDAVQPRRTSYTLETMPWIFPDSTESYLRLITAVNRKAFAVHFDPVNLVSSPQRYYANGALIREFVAALGPHIKSVHAKDILLREKLTVHLDEVRPGLGYLDYRTLLQALDGLGFEVPLMIEHLPSPEEYSLAADYIRRAAQDAGVQLKSPK